MCCTRITFTNQFAIHFDVAVGFGPVLLKCYRFHQWLKNHKYRHIILPSAPILKGAESNYLRFNLIICFLFVWIVNNQTIRTFPLCIFAYENSTGYLVRALIRCKWAFASCLFSQLQSLIIRPISTPCYIDDFEGQFRRRL